MILNTVLGKIPQADYISRYSYQEQSGKKGNICFINPFPIDRNLLITETKNAYPPILSAFKNGWSITAKKWFPEFYTKREEISVQTDGIIMINDQILIPPCCRQEMLNHLHKSHLGRDKIKSLARLICWWPEINHDIVNFVRNCKRCAVKPNNHKNWKSWPTTMYPM